MNDTVQLPKEVQQIREDIGIIVGGDFTPDCLGPERYQHIRDRAQNRPREYLVEFEAMFLGTQFDAVRQSEMYLPSFLRLIADRDPASVRGPANCLLKLYRAVLLAYDEARNRPELLRLLPDETGRTLERLVMRRAELVQLAS